MHAFLHLTSWCSYSFLNYRISSFIFICKHFCSYYFWLSFNPSCPAPLFSGMWEVETLLQYRGCRSLLHPQLAAAACSSQTLTLFTLSSAEMPVPPKSPDKAFRLLPCRSTKTEWEVSGDKWSHSSASKRNSKWRCKCRIQGEADVVSKGKEPPPLYCP